MKEFIFRGVYVLDGHMVEKASFKNCRVLKKNGSISEEEKNIVVVSMSPQARASLAAKHELTAKEAAQALHFYFKQLGADIVLDTTYARELVLLQTAKEFLDRYSISQIFFYSHLLLM